MCHNIDRLANILMHTNENKLWNIVKQVKAQRSYDPMSTKVRAVEEKVKIKTSESVSENMPRQHLNSASEMFLYLYLSVDSTTTMWMNFFGNLFETQSATQIILTLNRMMRKTKGMSIYTVNEKLFKKSTILFKLKYPEILGFMLGRYKNISSTASRSFIIRG